jgi:hypothetical protein
MKLTTVLVTLFAVSVCSPAYAAVPPVSSIKLTNQTADTPCNANIHTVDSPACTTVEMYVARGEQLRLNLTWDRTAATDLRVWVDTSIDGDPPWSAEASPVIGSAQVDLNNFPLVIDTAADGSISWQYSAFATGYVRFRFLFTAGGASDLISLDIQYR